MITKEELLRWQTDEEFQLEQVKEYGHSIKYIHNPSEAVCLEAVKRNGCTIQYIHNPSERVCLEALHNCKLVNLNMVIRYIDIEKYPDLYEKYCFMKV